MTQPLANVARFREFRRKRDLVLEQILQNAQLDISRILHGALEQILDTLTRSYMHMAAEGYWSARSRLTLKQMGQRVDQVFAGIEPLILARIERMKRNVFLLSSAGEAQAIAVATGKDFRFHLSKEHVQAQGLSLTARGEEWSARIHLTLARLGRKIIDAVELSRVQEDDLQGMIDRVKGAFPKIRASETNPRHLKKLLREADPGDEDDKPMVTTFIDDDQWNDVLDAYKSTELPEDRFDNQAKYFEDGKPVYAYQWEIEQDMAHDFVTDVRKGENEAANQAGIKDFVFIAILDDKTDECCKSRDGYTTKEIEEMLASGKLDKDLCDGVEPPIHMNCRCRLSPVGDAPERVEADYGEFEEWLTS